MRPLTVNKFQIKLPALFRFDLGILTGKKLRNSTQTLPGKRANDVIVSHLQFLSEFCQFF